MDLLNLTGILMAFIALFAYLNSRYFKLPITIGLFMAGMCVSILMWALSAVFPLPLLFEKSLLNEIDFQKILMDGMLSLLLFAGTIKLDLKLLRSQRWTILIFAFIATILSAFIVGLLFYYGLQCMGLSIPLLHAFIFGAVISPTDPVAVLGMLDETNIPESLKVKIAGESLFNDGVGYVLFLTLYQVATQNTGDDGISLYSIVLLFARQVGGAFVLGALLGAITAKLKSRINDYQTGIFLSLAMVIGGYALANALGVSGPITMVVGGLVLMNTIHMNNSLSMVGKDYLVKFWELVDMLLNAILFLLIGLLILQIAFNESIIMAGLLAIAIVLLSRFCSLSLLIHTMKRWVPFEEKSALIMTWGGLRGGISVAMAISLSDHLSRDLILGATYIVVFFSILVQGLSLKSVISKLGVATTKE